jgi:hypothetical protein
VLGFPVRATVLRHVPDGGLHRGVGPPRGRARIWGPPRTEESGSTWLQPEDQLGRQPQQLLERKRQEEERDHRRQRARGQDQDQSRTERHEPHPPDDVEAPGQVVQRLDVGAPEERLPRRGPAPEPLRVESVDVGGGDTAVLAKA